jgi:hypothetical protein
VVVGKQRVPAHEEVTPAGPGYCCAFDLNMKLDCGMHLNCPEERRQVQERCVLTVKGDGCKAVEVDWSCATFDNVEVGQVVTTTVGCAAEPTRRS